MQSYHNAGISFFMLREHNSSAKLPKNIILQKYKFIFLPFDGPKRLDGVFVILPLEVAAVLFEVNDPKTADPVGAKSSLQLLKSPPELSNGCGEWLIICWG